MTETVAYDAKAALKKDWWVYLLGGIASFFIGWVLLKSPVVTVVNFVIFLGFYWLIAGIVDIVMAIADHRDEDHTGLRIIGGVLGIFAGLIILNNPIFSAVFTPIFFAYFAAFAFIVNGVIKMFIGNEYIKETGETYKKVSIGSVIVGLMFFIFGVWLLAAPTLVTVSTMVLVSGIYLLVNGIAMAALGVYIKFAN